MLKRYFILASLLIVMMGHQNCSQTKFSQQSQNLSSQAQGGGGGNTTDSNDEGTTVSGVIAKTKSINVTESKKVDVLVVVDNSGSMEIEQKNMSSRFSSFLSQLQGLDWSLAITTTDSTVNEQLPTTDGKLIPFGSSGKSILTSKDDPTLVNQLFSETIQRSERGSGSEQGLNGTYRVIERALAGSAPNSQFIRADAALSVVVVTDADEYVNNKAKTPDQILSLIKQNYPNKSFKFHSIIVKPNDQNCLRSANSNEAYGLAYAQLSQATGGVIGSVCESDYGGQLNQMGMSTVEQIREIQLDCNPIDADKNGHLDVVLKDKDTSAAITDFEIVGSKLILSRSLNAGSYFVNYNCQK